MENLDVVFIEVSVDPDDLARLRMMVNGYRDQAHRCDITATTYSVICQTVTTSV
jgi:hypothetical protein